MAQALNAVRGISVGHGIFVSTHHRLPKRRGAAHRDARRVRYMGRCTTTRDSQRPPRACCQLIVQIRMCMCWHVLGASTNWVSLLVMSCKSDSDGAIRMCWDGCHISSLTVTGDIAHTHLKCCALVLKGRGLTMPMVG